MRNDESNKAEHACSTDSGCGEQRGKHEEDKAGACDIDAEAPCRLLAELQGVQPATAEQRSGNAEFGVYTFPRDGKGELKVTVTALNASDVLVKEQLFEHVPITKNRISLCKENFFGTPVNTNNNTFSFVVNDEWEQQEYTH